MDESFMNSTTPTDNLTLFDVSRRLLAELQGTNRILSEVLNGQRALNNQLQDLLYLVNGFTSGGASFSGYALDPMTTAYLAIMGPAIATRLADQGGDLPELMKGSALLARQLLEELAAYRSERSAIDYVEEQAELINDPWKQQGESTET